MDNASVVHTLKMGTLIPDSDMAGGDASVGDTSSVVDIDMAGGDASAGDTSSVVDIDMVMVVMHRLMIHHRLLTLTR